MRCSTAKTGLLVGRSIAFIDFYHLSYYLSTPTRHVSGGLLLGFAHKPDGSHPSCLVSLDEGGESGLGDPLGELVRYYVHFRGEQLFYSVVEGPILTTYDGSFVMGPSSHRQSRLGWWWFLRIGLILRSIRILLFFLFFLHFKPLGSDSHMGNQID